MQTDWEVYWETSNVCAMTCLLFKLCIETQEKKLVETAHVKKIRKLEVKTRDLCWSKIPIKHFFTVESACAPCISLGSSLFWRSCDNHNRTFERYIGKMALVLNNGWVKDKCDVTLDDRVRGYILNME